ncbi:hypothetical protein GCK72_025194 [Caenorhabditis remanei]|uniref:Uncharacterized protein n=2 Tax=Caenorhabditis remanei TaxID=31234 RepID=E3MZ91_CAERE|nr:hypothetical protein GCK72_025194 [Caenorhabditis remanei]EFP12886.1 hypothetical protein CRE_05918 [Caenorhabditis remanei]KAF1748727.1 hypothetical protein GCK72_025194 [Caenorhabditis remanei]
MESRCMPCIIATLYDFGYLEASYQQNISGYTQFNPTMHFLDKKDMEKILNLTAIRMLIRSGRTPKTVREYRVRVMNKEQEPRFLHVTSLKVCDIENMVVKFYWKPIRNLETTPSETNTVKIPINSKRIANFFSGKCVTP